MPLNSEKNDVSSFSQSPLIGLLSNLQVTRTGIKARMSLNLGQIGLFTLELFTLERRIFSHRLVMEKIMSPHFISYYEFIKLTGNKDRPEMLDGFEFLPDLTSHFGVTCP